MSERLGVAAVTLAVLAPWTTWLALGVTVPTADYLRASEFFLAAGGVALFGAVLALEDLWLGLFVITAALRALVARQDVFTAFLILLAASALVAVRAATSAGWARWLRHLLVATALGQALLALGQALLWRPDWAAGMPPLLLAAGTFGNVKFMGALLAIVTPLAPLWALPILGIGLVLSQSGVACLAAVVGLLVRPDWPVRWRLGGGVVALSALAGAMTLRSLTLDSVWARWRIWTLAFQDHEWGQWLIGRGPSSWSATVPDLQVSQVVALPTTIEVFRTAHNEPLQLVYEFGLLGVVLVVGWLWTYRRPLLTSPWRGAAAAVAILMCWLHIFHVPMVAPAAIAILGMATSDARG